MQEEIRLRVNIEVTCRDIHGRGLVLVHVFRAAGERGVDSGLLLNGQGYGSFSCAHSWNTGIVS